MNATNRHIDRKLAESTQAGRSVPWLRPRTVAERRNLAQALLLSLAIHALLLTLTFHGQGHWIPGFGFPWQDRRIEAPDLQVELGRPQVASGETVVTSFAEPSRNESESKADAAWPTPKSFVVRAPGSTPTPDAIAPVTNPSAGHVQKRVGATGAAAQPTPLHGDRPGDVASLSIPAPAVTPLARPDESTWVVPTTPTMPTPAIVAVPSASTSVEGTPSLPDGGDAPRVRIETEAERQEAARAEAERVEAARIEAARIEAARVEAARVEAARVEAARVEAAR
ncbi:MAG TPA: hypothetical protein PLW68_14160, partial [Casimicrobiaceae bacterium]|nr:hypothetical protein [Casimicrobiaceae bacterium]